jgi:hypothetical protein
MESSNAEHHWMLVLAARSWGEDMHWGEDARSLKLGTAIATTGLEEY